MSQVRGRDGGSVTRTFSQVRGRDNGNTLRSFTRIRMRDATNTLRTVWEAASAMFSAEGIPDTAIKITEGPATHGTVTSDPYDAIVSGGTGPFTYAWAKVSGHTLTVATPTTYTTTFSADVYDSYDLTGIYRCAVTDTATGITVYTNNVTVQLAWVNNTVA